MLQAQGLTLISLSFTVHFWYRPLKHVCFDCSFMKSRNIVKGRETEQGPRPWDMDESLWRVKVTN